MLKDFNLLDHQGPLNLAQNEVQVWSLDLALAEATIHSLYELLNSEERQRADRFHFPHDRVHFIAARGQLRILLARHLNLTPTELQFSYSKYGKPSLVQAPELHFNLSHANTKALLAVTYAGKVGVDIEYTQKEIDVDGIAQRFFANNEYQLLQTLNGTAKHKAFFTAWTRKEAFLKALGKGVAYGLEKVEVSILPEQPAKIIALHDPALELTEWCMFALQPASAYIAALVVKRKNLQIQLGENN